MEPASIQLNSPRGRGSLEDPEVLENVPGHVIPIIEREFDDFDNEAKKFLDGGTPETEFIGFRLKQGVYGQRQPDVQMVRVKLPMGGVTPSQLEAFAEAIEKYAPLNKGHITTRQNIQVHHMPLPDAAQFIRIISDSGLSSREGCGNTVRNVTGDPWAGVAPDELFDLTPYAGAYVRYFVRHPTTQLMPRKVKTAFEGAAESDRSLTGIHDIAFIARERDGVKGVEVRVGGGTSIMPRIAPTLYEFVRLDDGEYLKVAEAVFRVFDRQDWLRKNRARARIKVLVDKVGIDEVRQMVDEELKGDWADERDFDVEALRLDVDEADNAPAVPTEAPSPNGDHSEFERFAASNVTAQRQEGFSAVQVAVPRGDLTPDQLRALADLARQYSGGWVRTTVHQNLLFRWVRDEAVYELWTKLLRARPRRRRRRRDRRRRLVPGHRLVQAGHHVVDGPEPRRAREARRDRRDRPAHPQDPHQDERLPERLQPAPHREHRVLRRVDQGRRAHGARLRRAHRRQLRRRRDRLRPAPEGAPARQARAGGRREVAGLLRARARRRARSSTSSPAASARRRFEDEVRELALPVEFGLETMDHFIDWSKKVPFVVERGEGECAV